MFKNYNLTNTQLKSIIKYVYILLIYTQVDLEIQFVCLLKSISCVTVFLGL